MTADIPEDALAGGTSGPTGNHAPIVTGRGFRCLGGGHMSDANRARSGRAVGV
jgi:hypothetical protein